MTPRELRARRARIKKSGLTRAQVSRAVSSRRVGGFGMRAITLDYMAFMTRTQKSINRTLKKELKALKAPVIAEGKRTDAAVDDVEKLLNALLRLVKKSLSVGEVRLGITTTGTKITASNRHKYTAPTFQVLGINDFPVRREARMLRSWVAENLSLIKGVNEDQIRKLRALFLRAGRQGIRSEDLTAQVQKILKTSETRAKLIARDQTSKLSGQLDDAKQTSMGITHYFWRSSLDERVRPTHQGFNGKRYSWDEGSPEGHPGQPVNCRCTAEPDLDSLLGTEPGTFRSKPKGKRAA